MINNLSLYISKKLIEKYEEEMPVLNILKYSIKFLIVNLLPVLFLLILSMITGGLTNYIKAMIGFALLRQVSGGYHIKRAELCVVISTSSIFLIANFSYLLSGYVDSMNLISLLLVLIFSPSNIEEQTRVNKKYHFVFKILSVIFIILSMYISDVVFSVAIIFQCLLLIYIPLKEVKIK
ncbi:accessory gene regulator B family protein [Paenibacillus odorifer]|uniref:accessory gene regulator B family protein n=1 Tax=Paenibacillus odorifer TaxID=189426 RepID=UPI00096C88BB|nr:accessory gene regulator B family protein [Paenibacillus odorifer]OMD66779.1 hypothetical protein BSK50_30655 [Paenibacillus odorifer]